MEKNGWIRDILFHGYFSIKYIIVWDVVAIKVPEIKAKITLVIEKLSFNNKAGPQ